ncbi:PspC domain-containing protein [Legionella jamestowniensis]|uniref:Phage shock protein C, PspC n=1 Tax=Legionella jamestowniensis TaxID=455 RepID=A0A0W0UGG0_9GAMM|nr:PspC domain-containing protein [Legionella jamestowniensis]KTD06758.1 phage shock protein C, PspC [Legionella jamestowniensis]SFL83680.1 phage shock protein C (PspC) family protein [Legionella jamestowniensis DSM 19215]
MKQLPQNQDSKKRLYRSRRDKMIAGVCGGLADYFNMDPTVMRLIFILLLLLGGSAILVYLIMWLVVPLEPVAD